MKKLSIIFTGIASVALFLSSCSPETTLQKDIKYMSIRFKPLTRADLTLVGNLQAEITVTGKGSGPKKAIDASFSANYKKGLITTRDITEILYFAPGPGEAISGVSLYENDIFNSVRTSGNVAMRRRGLFSALFPGAAARARANAGPGSDDAMNFAYYAMIEKYPDIDYFINVRFDRKTIYKGKAFSETVTVKADGVKLKTD